LEKQFKLAIQGRDLITADHETVMQIRDLRTQLQALQKRIGPDANAKPILDAIDAINKKMAPIESQLIEPKATADQDQLNYGNMLNSQLAYLENSVDDADDVPPQQDYDQYEIYRKQMAQISSDWKAILAKDVSDLNELMRKQNVPAIGIAKMPAEGQGGPAH
jgi:hypothetical protein